MTRERLSRSRNGGVEQKIVWSRTENTRVEQIPWSRTENGGLEQILWKRTEKRRVKQGTVE